MKLSEVIKTLQEIQNQNNTDLEVKVLDQTKFPNIPTPPQDIHSIYILENDTIVINWKNIVFYK